MNKLKPCPFCLGEATRSEGSHSDGLPWIYIECLNCGATADSEPAWNRRAAVPEIKTEAKSAGEACRWTEDEDGAFHTDCGQIWELIAGTLAENQIQFCLYCGRRIEHVPPVPEKEAR